MTADLSQRLGVALTPYKMQVVEAGYYDNRLTLFNLDEAYFQEPIDFLNDKEPRLLSILQTAANEIQSQISMKEKSIFFTLSPENFFNFTVPIEPTLMRQDVLTELRWEFSVLYPYIDTENYSLTYFESPENPLQNKHNVLVFALARKITSILSMFCKRNSFHLHLVDNAHLSADKAALFSVPELSEEQLISIYIGENNLSFTLSKNGTTYFYKTLTGGSQNELLALVQDESKRLEAQGINLKQIPFAFLYGENLSANLLTNLRNRTGINFSMMNPFQHIRRSQSVIENDYYLTKNYNFCSAAGVCYRAI